jgi:hypothetical protein
LEIFYRKILKQILSIPTNTADPAVYILAGAIPIESRIHKLALGMYANIFRTTHSIEREIAERQLGMKAINENSWFSKLKQILAVYMNSRQVTISWIFHLQKTPGKKWSTKQLMNTGLSILRKCQPISRA